MVGDEASRFFFGEAESGRRKVTRRVDGGGGADGGRRDWSSTAGKAGCAILVLAAAFFLGLEVDLVDLAATLARPVRGVARAEGAEAVRAGIGSEWTSAEGRLLCFESGAVCEMKRDEATRGPCGGWWVAAADSRLPTDHYDALTRVPGSVTAISHDLARRRERCSARSHGLRSVGEREGGRGERVL